MRARNLKPSTFSNELLGQADPLLTILFAGLWCMADKKGRLEDRPIKIKGEILRYREGIDINRYLTELVSLGFIRRYSVSGKAYIQVVNFSKHQNPHHTEKDSEIPEEIITLPKDPETEVKEPLNTGETPADSGFRIPDSLIPEELAALAWLPRLNLDSWERWVAFRKQAKFKSYKTNETAKALSGHSMEAQAWAVKHSIENQYQGLFPEKFPGGKHEAHKRPSEHLTPVQKVERDFAELERQQKDLEGGGADFRGSVVN